MSLRCISPHAQVIDTLAFFFVSLPRERTAGVSQKKNNLSYIYIERERRKRVLGIVRFGPIPLAGLFVCVLLSLHCRDGRRNVSPPFHPFLYSSEDLFLSISVQTNSFVCTSSTVCISISSALPRIRFALQQHQSVRVLQMPSTGPDNGTNTTRIVCSSSSTSLSLPAYTCLTKQTLFFFPATNIYIIPLDNFRVEIFCYRKKRCNLLTGTLFRRTIIALYIYSRALIYIYNSCPEAARLSLMNWAEEFFYLVWCGLTYFTAFNFLSPIWPEKNAGCRAMVFAELQIGLWGTHQKRSGKCFILHRRRRKSWNWQSRKVQNSRRVIWWALYSTSVSRRRGEKRSPLDDVELISMLLRQYTQRWRNDILLFTAMKRIRLFLLSLAFAVIPPSAVIWPIDAEFSINNFSYLDEGARWYCLMRHRSSRRVTSRHKRRNVKSVLFCFGALARIMRRPPSHENGSGNIPRDQLDIFATQAKMYIHIAVRVSITLQILRETRNQFQTACCVKRRGSIEIFRRPPKQNSHIGRYVKHIQEQPYHPVADRDCYQFFHSSGPTEIKTDIQALLVALEGLSGGRLYAQADQQSSSHSFPPPFLSCHYVTCINNICPRGEIVLLLSVHQREKRGFRYTAAAGATRKNPNGVMKRRDESNSRTCDETNNKFSKKKKKIYFSR